MAPHACPGNRRPAKRLGRPSAAVLADMLLLTGGWEFEHLHDAFADATGPRGWSAVVWELLLRSAANEHRRSGTSGADTEWDPDRDQVRFTDEEDARWPETDDDDRGGIAVLRVRVDGRNAQTAPAASELTT